MARSLRPAAWQLIRDAVARSVAESLTKRDVMTDAQNKVTDVKTAFSSWDNCMKASFCKWPVIAVIIVGSLIIVSVICCFECLKCCGNCCGCCDPPGGRQHKYLDEPYIPPYHGQSQGYRNQAPMQAHFSPPAATKFEPQYAEFDVSKKTNGDDLPPMPSWERSGSKKVLMEQEEVEMSNLARTPVSPLNRTRINSPSPALVSPMSVNHDRPYGDLPGSSSGHSQQDLLTSPQSPGYGLLRQGSYGPRDPGYNNSFNTNRHSAGFGLNDPYDDHAPMSGANGYGHTGGQSQPYEAPGNQPYDNIPYGAAAGAGGFARATAMRNQSRGPNDQPYGALPVVGGAALGHGGRQSPVPAQGSSPYGLNQIHEQFAEMPAVPLDHDSVHNSAGAPQNRSPLTDQTAPRELAGSTPPEGYGMRGPGTGDNHGPLSAGGRSPYGMDSRMRSSPAPIQTAGSLGGNPYAPSPREDQGYGRELRSPLDNEHRSYSPIAPHQFTPGPERQYSPAPDRQRTPGPLPPANPVPPPSNTLNQSPPRSPFTNNSGFDFDSGFSRPREQQHHSSPAQEPATAAYPGQRTYQSR
ncbi:uncharacterized protein MAM_05725 [Metarhizium album ARSEF 1941]|uniref:Fibroin-3 related protein n=1 Tax=Metarhizium album (strain ARSEF 1941) TaxID=1081103 RepID=A0A0B2WK52_METAS|nr:uncharacterized protein MAM_05725 [Metarhizium album ARSEF 1941]KHN96436.1 hypothetical protein MAM_05725 [Metarhizium album ARSEF 1941]